jgi:hypothetical protein
MRMIYRSIALKSDAARYDVAMRTIAGVTSMRLEDPQELKAGLAILSEQLTYLKLHRSKLTTLVLNDYTFTTALKEACPNQGAAATLIREWRANPKAVFKLRGAHVLSVRLMESVRADATILRRIARRVREATAPSGPPINPIPSYQPFAEKDWGEILFITCALGMMETLFSFGSLFDSIFAGLSADMINCQAVAYRQYFECLSVLQSHPGLERDKLSARCVSTACEQLSECWVPRMRRRLPWDNLPSLK